MTVDREFGRPNGVVKGIEEVCQLLGRCAGHRGDERRLWEV